MDWTRVADETDLDRKGRLVVRHAGRRILVLRSAGELFAMDARCPHEGYPLSVGDIDGQQRLTCNWHNWKFDLPTGRCLVGEDDVRVYGVRCQDGGVFVHVPEPRPEAVRAAALAGLRRGVEDRQTGRIARELARMVQAGLDPVEGVRETVAWATDRGEYGMTHAWAATADWLARWTEEAADPGRGLVTLTEALDHFAFDMLREPAHPYPTGVVTWSSDALLAAIEAEDGTEAQRILNGAFAAGLGWDDLEPTLVRAALAHYYSFGHGLIFVQKSGELVRRLGADAAPGIVRPLVRGILYARREERIPEFSAYARHLATAPAGAEAAAAEPGATLDASGLQGAGVERALGWVSERLGKYAPGALHHALMDAAAWNLLHFDERVHEAWDVPVNQTAGWLDLTHALTFGHAVRCLAERVPSAWTTGLLQMALFQGRNRACVDADRVDAAWAVADADAFWSGVWDGLLDHGVPVPILACHRLKTARAVYRELADGGYPPKSADRLLAALNRYLAAPLKMKHTRRLVRQALDLVAG